MAKKIKISFASVPESILKQDEDGEDILELEVPTTSGRKRVVFHDGDVVSTDDTLVELALKNYAPPRIPINRKAKGENSFSKMYYDYDTVKDIRPFAGVGASTKATKTL